MRHRAKLALLFDNYEISGCKEFRDGNGTSYTEPVEDDEAEFWTLYGHTEGEGVMAIGDFKTRKVAENVYFRIVGKRFTASYEADAALRVRHSADQMLAALKFALPFMEDLANSSDNKGERRAAKLMREAICEAQESEP
jgi:hypothetical protein